VKINKEKKIHCDRTKVGGRTLKGIQIHHYFSKKTWQENYKRAFKDTIGYLNPDVYDTFNVNNGILISFNLYRFSDYPDQEEMKELVRTTYENSDGDLYWAGMKYESLELLIEELQEQKCIGELIIEENKV
jgi:hypothetical protein